MDDSNIKLVEWDTVNNKVYAKMNNQVHMNTLGTYNYWIKASTRPLSTTVTTIAPEVTREV